MRRSNGKDHREVKHTRVNAALTQRGRWRRHKGQHAFFKAGAWNVRTMLCYLKLKRGEIDVIGGGLGKEEMLCNELERKGISICALSEVRWAGQGEYKHGDYLFLYSGKKETANPGRGKHASQQGVAIVINKVIAQAWKDSGSQVSYIDERMMSIRGKIGGDTFVFISVYGPTFKAEEHVKDNFYDNPREEVRKVKSNEVLIALGDWNARVGVSDDTWHEVLGPYGNNERNDNGMRLLETCLANKLCVTNTFFEHKEYNTWRHNRFKTWHTLDHIVVNRRCKDKILDTKVVQDAECDTDHRLVITKIRPSKTKERQGPKDHA